MSGELTQVPPVVLSERAFDWAQREGIIDIQPDAEQMHAAGNLTQTGDTYLPDVTVLRDGSTFRKQDWDISLLEGTALNGALYAPSSQLAIPKAEVQTVTAAGLRSYASTGKKLVELTVLDWDGLGERLVRAIEERKSETGGASEGFIRLSNAVGEVATGIGRLLGRGPASGRETRIAKARTLRPYTVTSRDS